MVSEVGMREREEENQTYVVVFKRELTHVGVFLEFQLGMSKMCWVKSRILLFVNYDNKGGDMLDELYSSPSKFCSRPTYLPNIPLCELSHAA